MINPLVYQIVKLRKVCKMCLNVITSKKENDENKAIPGLKTAIRVTSAKDARRLMSRLLLEYQKGTITSQTFKDLIYGLSNFINVFRAEELENELEKIIEEKNKNVK